MVGPGEKAANSILLLGVSLLLNLGLFGFLCAQAAVVNRLSAQIEKLLAAEAHITRIGARIDSLSAQYQAFAKVFARSNARSAPYMPALDMLLYEQGAWFVQMTLERALKKMLNVYHTRPSARRQSASEESAGSTESDASDESGESEKNKTPTSASGSGSGSDDEPGNESEHSSENDRLPTISVSPETARAPSVFAPVAVIPNGNVAAAHVRSARATGGVSRSSDSR